MTSRRGLRCLVRGGAATLGVLAVGMIGVVPAGGNTDGGTPCQNLQHCTGGGDVDQGDPAVIAEVTFNGPGDSSTSEVPTGESIFANCIVELVLAGDKVSKFGPLVMANIGDYVWTEDYWVIDCEPGNLTGLYFYPDGPVPPPAWVIDDMIADAYRRTPVLAFNPITSPDGDDAISLLVHIPTYLWVDTTAWAPVSATATIPGGFSVTTTATPDRATWTGGENPITCSLGDMTPYDPTRGEDNQLSNCYTHYRHSSATHNHSIDLAVTWTVSYTCSTGTCGGPLPDLTTTSTRDVIVKEIQAVATPNP